jgi:cell division transport system permease protein
MKLLKSFVSFTFPLIIMLFIYSVYLLVNKIVEDYQKGIINDYSIVIITNTPFKAIDEIAGMSVKEIEPINRKKIIDDVKENLSKNSIKLLDKKLPYFYKIYLDDFPTTLKLQQIRKELSEMKNVRKIETFSTDHNKIYSLLLLIQDIVFILFIVVLVLSLLLLSKQIKIWFYEHSERITIIQLHGGSLLYASKPIIKTILLSALSSSILVVTALYFIADNLAHLIQPEIVSILPNVIHLELEVLQIVALSFFIPLITFFGLLIQYKAK